MLPPLRANRQQDHQGSVGKEVKRAWAGNLQEEQSLWGALEWRCSVGSGETSERKGAKGRLRLCCSLRGIWGNFF